MQYTITNSDWTQITKAGAFSFIVPAGIKICLEVDNNYTDVVNFTMGLVWYEI